MISTQNRKAITALFLAAALVAPVAATAQPLEAASSAPFKSYFHLHTTSTAAAKAAKTSLVQVTVRNDSFFNRDVLVGGHVYNVMPKHSLLVRGPAGTQIIAASNERTHVAGSQLLEIGAAADTPRVVTLD